VGSGQGRVRLDLDAIFRAAEFGAMAGADELLLAIILTDQTIWMGTGAVEEQHSRVRHDQSKEAFRECQWGFDDLMQFCQGADFELAAICPLRSPG
jgi:hypothetical protein